HPQAQSASPVPGLTGGVLLPAVTTSKLLSIGMSRGADFAEVYVERGASTSVTLEENRVKSAQRGMSCGVGVRVVSGPRFGYAYSDDLDDSALERAAGTAALIAAGP